MAGKIGVDAKTPQVVLSSLRPVPDDLAGTGSVTECEAAPDEALSGQVHACRPIGRTVLPSFKARPEALG